MRKWNHASIIVMALVVGGMSAAQATTTSKNLQLTWSGVVPTSPAVTGEWRFVSQFNENDNFVPTVGSITVNPDAVVAGGRDLVITPVQFAMKTTATTTAFTAASEIRAYLVAPVLFQGLVPRSATAAAPTMEISSGSTPLRVGSANAVTISSISGSTTDSVPVTLTGRGKLPPESFSEGDTFSSVATVMFTASVGV